MKESCFQGTSRKKKTGIVVLDLLFCKSILIRIERDTGANKLLLMNDGNTRLFTTESDWLFKGTDFSLNNHTFLPLISYLK